MKIIVTGAAGFIGKKLVKRLIENDHEVIAVDLFIADGIFDKKVKCVEGGVDNILCDKHLLSNADVCFHLAWAGNSGDGRGDYAVQSANITNSVNLINMLVEVGCKRFVGVGTLAEYDIENYIPRDGATPNITSEYAIAKMSARYFTKTECVRAGIDHVWCQLSNTYGEGNTTSNFINFAAKTMLAGKRASFTEGKQLYDFMYIDDTVEALMLAGIKGKNLSTYYLGSGQPRQLKEYIFILRDAIDPNIELHLGEIPFNGISLPMETYDTSKLYADTGFCAKTMFNDGIKRTINWMREQ